MDKPFTIGQSIVLFTKDSDEVTGEVSSMGLLSTRLKTEDGLISIPNRVFSDAIVKRLGDSDEPAEPAPK